MAPAEQPPSGTVPAHQQQESHHYLMHFPPHPARADDPHYADFDHYHRKTRATARCFIGERIGYGDCKDAQCKPCPPPADGGEQPGLELHHAHVEFSLQNGVDLAALEKDYPGISDPSQVGAWVESAQNFRWLCCAEGTRVLLPGGRWHPIEDIRPGDVVIGSDGLGHKVTAARSRRHLGAVFTIPDGPTLTGEHPVLTPEGWRPVARVAPDDLVYRFAKDAQGVRAAAKVNVGEVHDGPAFGLKVRVPGAVIADPVAVPLHPVYLNDDAVGGKHGIGHVAAHGAEFLVGNARGVQCLEQPGFQAGRAVPDGPPLAVVVVVPHAGARAVETALVPVGIRLGVRGGELGPANAAVRGTGRGAGQCVERFQPTGIGAVFASPGPFEVGTVHLEGSAASLAGERQNPPVRRLLSPGGGAFPRAGAVAVRKAADYQERTPARHAVLLNSRPSGGRWSPVGEIAHGCHDLKVYDITVEGSHDFVADGIVVHNCAWHHRGAAGAHTASHSDWEASQYVLGLIGPGR